MEKARAANTKDQLITSFGGALPGCPNVTRKWPWLAERLNRLNRSSSPSNVGFVGTFCNAPRRLLPRPFDA